MLSVARQLRRRVAPRLNPNVLIEEHVTLDGCELLSKVVVGYRSYANNSLLRNIEIGRFCSIGRRCSLGAARHSISGVSSHPRFAPRGFVRDPNTTIGNDVWIGDNVIVLAGVSVGDGSVLGGGCVVTKDVQPYAIVGGVPARLIRPRFDPALADALVASHWWRFGDRALEAFGEQSPTAFLAWLQGGELRQLAPHHRPLRT